MSSLRVPTLRYTLNSCRACPRLPQRRWAQVHDVRFLATHVSSAEKVFDKYKDKLDRKAKEAGLSSAEELKKVYQEKLSNAPPTPPASPTSSAQQPSAPSNSAELPPTPPSSPVPNIPKANAGMKTLSSFLDLPKTQALPQKEIESLWRLRHASSPQSLCATIPYPVYQKLEATARRHPQFILPLAKEGQGAEIHFLQWTFPTPETTTVLFTHLAEYKLRGEYAQPHTTVTHHLELAKDKGVVLLQGNVMEGRGVSVDEGRFLLMSLQKFYAGEGVRSELLEKFSKGDQGFKVEDVVEEAEKII